MKWPIGPSPLQADSASQYEPSVGRMKKAPYMSTAGSRNQTCGRGRRIAFATHRPTVSLSAAAAAKDRLEVGVRLDGLLHVLCELRRSQVAGEDAGRA